MIIDLRWETPEEREVVERLLADWTMYGQIHMTNAPRGNGITRLDPAGITYRPTGKESTIGGVAVLDEAVKG